MDEEQKLGYMPMPPRAYVDHNFLIYCANNPAWRDLVIAGVEEGRVQIVLSPWSTYEIGDNTPERMEELLNVAEDFNPIWIKERAELQLQEFLHHWHGFWGYPTSQFRPFGTLAEIMAPVLRFPVQSLGRFTMRDFARTHQIKGERDWIGESAVQQKEASVSNQMRYRSGNFTDRMMITIDMNFVATMLAGQGEVGPFPHQLRLETYRILSNGLAHARIRFFIECGGLRYLRTYQIESSLTESHWRGKAILNKNRFIDRLHAIGALSYCDLFVTSDTELTKLCSRVGVAVPFAMARIISSAEFVEFLRP